VDRYRISELAERVGVPPTTLRHYGSQGLLPARRTGGGYRTYDDRDVERMRFITAAKRLGLPLRRIRDLLGVWQDGVCRDVRARLRPLVVDQLDGIDRQIADLRVLRDDLTGAQARLDALPSRSTPCDPTCLSLTGVRAPHPSGEPPVNGQADPPVTCSLTGGDRGRRAEQWRDVLRGTTPEWTAGTAVRTTVPLDRLPTLTALVAAESCCCPFLVFHLTVDADGVRVGATAPAGARALLEELFTGIPTGRRAC
jgi:DNA-binding transcriptional MerR regulator